MIRSQSSLTILAVLLGSFALPAARAQCPSAWSPTIGAPGANGQVRDLISFDDGSGAGSQLYAAGDFTAISGVAADHLARWNGSTWSPLGQGVSGPVNTLAVYDDGSGPALYAGGQFQTAGGQPANNIARWNGTTWSALTGGISGPFAQVYALAVHDDGTGFSRALYVAGYFSSAGGLPASLVARWSSSGWSIPGALGGEVHSLCVFDSGNGPELYAGGVGVAAGFAHVARWNGVAWSNLPAGVPNAPFGAVESMCVFDDGNGPALFVGGDLQNIGYDLKRFDGTTWTAVGPLYYSDKFTHVGDMVVHDDGTGPALWITGDFRYAGPFTTTDLARWDGRSWSICAQGLSGLPNQFGLALASHDDGMGSALYVGGMFTSAGGVPAHNIARLEANGGLPSVAAPTGPSSAIVGETVQLNVVASGAGPLSYQWHHTGYDGVGADGGPVMGATTSTLTVQIVSNHFADGIYSVIVTGPCGSTSGPGHALSVQDGPGVPLCDGFAGCPCNNGSVGNSTQGCSNSLGGNGWLAAQGVARIAQDSLLLLGKNMTSGAVLYFQGTTALGNGVPFGDGKRCAGGTVTRLSVKHNANGASRYPDMGDAPLSVAGGLTGATTRIYQAWYRDAASFCTSATYNLTNGVSVVWAP